MAKHTKQGSTNTPAAKAQPSTPAAKAMPTAQAVAQPTAQAVAQPTPPTVRTLPGNVLAALVAKGATLAHCAANPKRANSKAAAVWPTLAKCPTVALAVATPGMALHVAYGLAHGQCAATVPGVGTVGNTSGQPLTLAQLAAARQALGLV